jgi:gamma-glutamylcyclotransferase (GGCT)/AIG2-like uncharacterized protein YtfP
MNTKRQDKKGAIGPIRIFVYGTLKSGYWNHERFCQGAYYIEEAVVRGQLNSLLSGIPVLKVPESDVLVIGTPDPMADAATQEQFQEEAVAASEVFMTDWQMIQGEMIVFPDPQSTLPPIDRLEGFRPGSQSLYLRVLVPIVTKDGVQPAWCYVASENMNQDIVPTGKTIWP